MISCCVRCSIADKHVTHKYVYHSKPHKDVDTRFGIWSEREDPGNHHASSLPAFHFGRIAVCSKTKSSNEFLTKGRLGVKRRPDRVARLPAFKDIMHAESLSADADVLTRERATASLEKLAAQKGLEYAMVVLESIIDGLPLTQATPLLFVDTWGDREGERSTFMFGARASIGRRDQALHDIMSYHGINGSLLLWHGMPDLCVILQSWLHQ